MYSKFDWFTGSSVLCDWLVWLFWSWYYDTQLQTAVTDMKSCLANRGLAPFSTGKLWQLVAAAAFYFLCIFILKLICQVQPKNLNVHNKLDKIIILTCRKNTIRHSRTIVKFNILVNVYVENYFNLWALNFDWICKNIPPGHLRRVFNKAQKA